MGNESRFKNSESNNFLIEIGKGNIPTHFPVEKFGESPIVGTTQQTITSLSMLQLYQETPIILKVSSTNINDAWGGTGAQAIRVIGHGPGNVFQWEDVKLNGQTEVLTTKLFLRQYRTFVLEDKNSLGIIYVGDGVVTTGVPATKYMKIPIASGFDDNQTLMSLLTIPAGYYGLLHNAQIFAGTGKELSTAFMQRPEGGVWRVVRKGLLIEDSAPWTWNAKRFEQFTDLEIRAFIASTPNIAASASFAMTFVKLNNDVPDLSVPDSIHYQAQE